MMRALELAERGIGFVNPNPLVGAVLVQQERIIGEGYHEYFGGSHAEVNAVNQSTEPVDGGTLYVNLEPCSHYGKTPPCVEFILRKKIKRVVIGTLDPNPLVSGKGVRTLKDAGIEVTVGVCAEECMLLNEVFFHFIKYKTPFLIAKGGMSMDGKISDRNGKGQWITCEEARRDAHQLRNQYMGIMVGVNTIVKDNPKLTCRIEGGRNPIPIVIDPQLRTPMISHVLQARATYETITFPDSVAVDNQGMQKKATISPIFLCSICAPKDRVDWLCKKGARVIGCEDVSGKLSIREALIKLGECGIDSILLEGGSILNESAYLEGVVNKVVLYIAPKMIGGTRANSYVGGDGVTNLSEAPLFSFHAVQTVGSDLKIVAYPQ